VLGYRPFFDTSFSGTIAQICSVFDRWTSQILSHGSIDINIRERLHICIAIGVIALLIISSLAYLFYNEMVFAGQSYPYRGIHFLFILPGLLAFSCQPAERRRRLLFSVSSIVIVLLMWEEWLRRAVNYLAAKILVSPEIPNITFWLGRELAWWWLVGLLGGLLLTDIWVSNALLDFRTTVANLSSRLLGREPPE
jgi:hypothetical protein